MKDIVVEKEKLKGITLIPVDKIFEVLEKAIDWKGKQNILKQIKKASK